MRLFLLGVLVTLTPSALTMAWLLWQSADFDMDAAAEAKRANRPTLT
jgi:hypothetical protein